ncbi:MAG: hypothetical protein IPP40_06815 [bacterium]|nr:hypothetical protein [bacterium]
MCHKILAECESGLADILLFAATETGHDKVAFPGAGFSGLDGPKLLATAGA